MRECGTHGPDWEQHGESQALLELRGCSRLDFNLEVDGHCGGIIHYKLKYRQENENHQNQIKLVYHMIFNLI